MLSASAAADRDLCKGDIMDRYCFDDTELRIMERSKVPFAVYQFIDRRVVTLALSAGFCELFGYECRDEAYHDMDNNMYRYTHPDDSSRIADAAFRFATENEVYDVIYRSRCSDGIYRIIHAKGEHVITDTGERLAYVWYTDEGVYSEDGGNKYKIARLFGDAVDGDSFIKASYYDHLTGLPTMTYFFDLALSKKAAIQKEGGIPAVLFFDLGGMKYFNHKYGFAEGDKLLQCLARQLAVYFGNENCCRMGQDHFAVITNGDGLEDRLESLFEACRTINEGRTLSVHVGIYQHWYDGIAASMACDRAKFACDTLKNLYSSGFSYYDMNMKDMEDRQQYIISTLDKAISEKWIRAYYQPIIRSVNGKVCEEEALARWIDPEKGMLSPAEFIPILEDHRMIYKLDLYMVECVLEKIKAMRDAGYHPIPQSVNLSRSDFDTCDIVEEIRRRTDDAGIDRSLLSIEITESIIGQDFEFMKAQVDRFRELGFAVWMDDFGSGYSSLDALQSIHFDLLKFDMRFMQKLGDGEKGSIILTELLRMASSLGMETVCEGVETAEQMQFLQETGCSKQQGYFYSKPIPLEDIFEKYRTGTQIGFEDPCETQYYEAVGRINLHDLSSITQDDHANIGNYFDVIPLAVLEIDDERVRFTRSNRSYRDFMMRCFDFTVSDKANSFHVDPGNWSKQFVRSLRRSCHEDGIIFTDESLPNNTTVHSCVRRIAVNPKSGITAVAVAILSAVKTDIGIIYANIARALASNFLKLFYVDLETEDFIEYTKAKDGQDSAFEQHGQNFFEKSYTDSVNFIYVDDRERFLSVFSKDSILRNIKAHGSFTVNYRLNTDNGASWIRIKVMHMQQDVKHIIIGVSYDDTWDQHENT